MEVELDSISNLPREIVEKILARLPIKEAVRTSILSTKWRGFNSLEHLDIRHITLAQHAFEDFIVRCPMLKKLILKYCDGFTNLCIDAPNLKLLGIDGSFEDVSLQNTLHLEHVAIHLEFKVRWAVGGSSNLLKFFVHLPNIRDLQISGYVLKYLAVGPLLRKLPQPILFLNDLYMDVNFTDLEEITTALCLVRSSPALRKLEIVVNHIDYHHVVGEVNSWFENLGENSDCQLTELRRIEIVAISDAKAELDFIKLLLLSSPLLECMTLKPFSLDGSLELLKQVVRFRRASVQAEIIFLDP